MRICGWCVLTVDSTLETSMEDFKEWLFPS